MKKSIICILTVFLACVGSAEEWSAPIGKKALSEKSKTVPGKVSPGLDFGAYQTKNSLVVFVRNGKHKMGSRTIRISSTDSVAPVLAQRISIAKPMSVINSKNDGAHLFESFTNGGKDYEIYYHIKGGKLTPKVTLSTKS